MRILHGNLVSLGQPCSVLFDHDLIINNGVIEDFYPHDSSIGQSAQDFDANGQFIFPGNICAHTHFYGAFSRGLSIPGAQPKDFSGILNRLWWKLDGALTEKDIYYSALTCLIDAIKFGTTTLFDHHSSPNLVDGSLDIIELAVNKSGLRCVLSYEVSDRNGFENSKSAVKENVRFLKKVKQSHVDNSKISASFGLHASFTLSDQTLQECVSAIPQDSGFHVHLAESEVDQHFSLKESGIRIVERLNQLNILGPQCILAHAVHINQAEAQLLSRLGSWVTHQPRSNMNNGVGMMPVELLLHENVNLCMGNDGFSNAMWQEWKDAYLVHRGWNTDPQALQGEDLIKIAISKNALLARKYFPHAPFSEISKGAHADLFFTDYDPPTPVTSDNIFWHILFGMNENMITSTMVAGEFLMKDRRLLFLDEEEILAESRALAKTTWERFGKSF